VYADKISSDFVSLPKYGAFLVRQMLKEDAQPPEVNTSSIELQTARRQLYVLETGLNITVERLAITVACTDHSLTLI